MAFNTGKKIVLTLKRIDQNTGIPTGQTKANVIGDPDYIPPSTDVVACPITVTTTCPIVAATASGTSILFEFSLDNTVVNNPNIKTVRINAKVGSTTISSNNFVLPNSTPNFFNGSLIGLSSGTTYTLTVDYLNASNGIIASCNNLGNITT